MISISLNEVRLVKTRFIVLMIISVQIALLLFQPSRTFAAPTLVGSRAELSSSLKNARPEDGTPPLISSRSSLFRDVPSVSGRYSVGDMTFLPYIGAGFGSGYTSELDRAFAPNLPPQQNTNVGGPLGPSMVPNEFQMGIRIPF